MPPQSDLVSEAVALLVCKENEQRMGDLICRSNHCDAPFLVTAHINGGVFHVTSVLSHPHLDWPEVTICLPAEERRAFEDVRPGSLKPWTEEEERLYSGFTVPLEWADRICAETTGRRIQ